MEINDFIKLPASAAAKLYRERRDGGDAAEASRLHQAYFEVHRVRLSANKQVAEADALEPRPAPTIPRPAGERSAIRRLGVGLLWIGTLVAAFAAAANIGSVGLGSGLALTTAGFTLWLAGVVEDRLIEIRQAIADTRGAL